MNKYLKRTSQIYEGKWRTRINTSSKADTNKIFRDRPKTEIVRSPSYDRKG